MADFASPEWIQELDDTVRGSDQLRRSTGDLDLIVRQTVTDTPSGDVSWHIIADHGSVRVLPGPGERADVVFTYDDETARQIGSGAISVQTAFMIGRLQIGGDTAKLMEHAPAFDDLADLFEALRARTTY